MKLECLSDWDGVKPHYPEWRRILDAAPSLTIFSTPEWLQGWWESYGANASLNFLLLREDNGVIAAMLPLYVTVVDSLFGKLRLARFVGDGSDDSDNLEFICLPGREDEAVEAMLHWIEVGSFCDICQLNTLPSHSALARAFRRKLRALIWAKHYLTRPQVLVKLPATWHDYLQQLSSKERGKIGNLTRRLQKEFEVNYLRVSSPDVLCEHLERLFQLHHMRWSLRNEAGGFSAPQRRAFYQKIANTFLHNGWLEFWFLELNNVQVAAQFCFAYRGVVYCLQEGFDPSYSSKSVGYILRSHVLRRMIEAGRRQYDFLGGEGDSKLRWAGEQNQYIDIHIAPFFSRGGALLMCRKSILACKKLISKRLPPKMLAVGRALLNRYAQKSTQQTQIPVHVSALAKQVTQPPPARLSVWF